MTKIFTRLALTAAVAATALATSTATAATKATLHAPATVSLRGVLTVHAGGLPRGRYALSIGRIGSHPKGGRAVVCSGPVGKARTVSGRVTFSGRLPNFLGCRTGAGPLLGSVATTTGRYTLIFGVPSGHGTFVDNGAFFQRTLRITP